MNRWWCSPPQLRSHAPADDCDPDRGVADQFGVAREASFQGRGRVLDRQINDMRRIWAGEAQGSADWIGPKLSRPVPILMGGHTEAALRRAAHLADGWIMGGGPTPNDFRKAAEHLKALWQAQGRDRKPRLIVTSYFAFGTAPLASAKHKILQFYGFAGPFAERIAASVLRDEAEISERIAGLEEVAEWTGGCPPSGFPCAPRPFSRSRA